jgi:hypothetical protein
VHGMIFILLSFSANLFFSNEILKICSYDKKSILPCKLFYAFGLALHYVGCHFGGCHFAECRGAISRGLLAASLLHFVVLLHCKAQVF